MATGTKRGKRGASDLAEMTVAELRDRAKGEGISGVSRMKKQDLLERLADTHTNGNGNGTGTEDPHRPVTATRATKYSQEITDADEHEERAGRSLVTTNHEVIRSWAEARGATPATVPGTRHGDHLGVLRFDFPGFGGDSLEHVSWDEWLATFDARELNFVFQEHKTDGRDSNFFRLDNPDREDG